uniref:Ig-like domain-containing protein n=1 Tax=Hucho hucho TaxID=62062 RepID=A0A4W5LSU1_9TELE
MRRGKTPKSQKQQHVFPFLTSSSFEDDKPTRPMVGGVEGDTITLSCSYTGSVDNLQWYSQSPRSKPEFLILITKSGYKTRVDLMISSVELEDSALYHCALQPTVTGNPENTIQEPVKTLGDEQCIVF